VSAYLDPAVLRELERSPALRTHLGAAAARIASLRQAAAAPAADAVATAGAPAPWPLA